MEVNVDEMLGKITDFIKNEAKSETVVGEAFQLGEFSCIPVIRVGMGFGTGGGEGDAPKQGHGSGGGAGAGMGMEPIGFLVTRDDEISFISTRGNKGLTSAIEKMPDVISKYFESKTKEPEAAKA